jgi:hypothetical protein
LVTHASNVRVTDYLVLRNSKVVDILICPQFYLPVVASGTHRKQLAAHDILLNIDYPRSIIGFAGIGDDDLHIEIAVDASRLS